VADVFGVSSVSPALETSAKLEDIAKTSLLLAQNKLSEGNTFAVKCRRVGSHAYSSGDICREVGQRILDKFGEKYSLKVNLNCPDVTIGIDIREDRVFVYDRVIEGQGGLPLGAQPRLVGIIDGKINSAAACWLVLKRGCQILPVYFDDTLGESKGSMERVNDYMRTLFDWEIGFPRTIHIISNGQNLREIEEKCPHNLTHVISKRLTYRIAEKIAETFKAEGIVTGEMLGGKEGLTVHDFSLLNQAIEQYPIHRPLLGFEEKEIKNLATRIGIKQRASKEKSCDLSSKPSRMIKLSEIVKAEKKLNMEEIIDTAIKSSKIASL